ncbi:unnamed protein product [Fraxinus pennsylvanica]|uniref:RIN4 pathogenic type III effector avirulence factor Avr cleavage site domain-containing protein n=1 Tax=Fraxinus pennsylvanica TaxID=56036 RepID=A0AAD1ZZG1_9LAMI|nr:unnamed protein product [Fraxinus pennsylvanica]
MIPKKIQICFAILLHLLRLQLPVSASTSKPRTRPDKPVGSGALGPTPDHRMSREEGDYRKFTNSPAWSEHMGRKTAKIVEGGSGSPAQEGKNSYDSSHGNPGRSRLKPAIRGAESPDRGAAIPKFGEWDEKDPQSAEDFTGIFDKAREEKHTGPGNVSTTPKHQSYVAHNHQPKEKHKKCCFPWW